MPKIRTEPVRGMRDILPPMSVLLRELNSAFSRVAESYGYTYAVLPTIELFELFAAKSGPEIGRSMYVFRDKAGREVALRPEFTASVARLYLRHFLPEPKPVKIYYYGQVFRYEEPQKGRYREFWQAGVELIGDPSLYADLELLMMVRDYYGLIGLSDYRVRLGNVGALRTLMREWGIPEGEQDHIIHLIDKKEVDGAVKRLRNYEAADPDMVYALVSMRTDDPEKVEEMAREAGIKGEAMKYARDLAALLRMSKEAGISNAYADLGFVRGLAYYTGTIFEVETPHHKSSIAGGGRYDGLIELYGGPPTPATGYSIGVDRTAEALLNAGVAGALIREPLKVMLVVSAEAIPFIDRVAGIARSAGASVDTRFAPKKKIGQMIGLASRKGYRFVIIVGEKEVGEGKVTIRDLVRREQVKVEPEEIPEIISSGDQGWASLCGTCA